MRLFQQGSQVVRAQYSCQESQVWGDMGMDGELEGLQAAVHSADGDAVGELPWKEGAH